MSFYLWFLKKKKKTNKKKTYDDSFLHLFKATPNLQYILQYIKWKWCLHGKSLGYVSVSSFMFVP